MNNNQVGVSCSGSVDAVGVLVTGSAGMVDVSHSCNFMPCGPWSTRRAARNSERQIGGRARQSSEHATAREAAETAAMTRIAAGAGTPNQPSIDDPPADAVKTALPAGPAIAPAGTRSSTVAGDAGPDRPAPTQGAGSRSVATDAGVFLKALKQWEGQHPFMYADTRGYVTTGIGHLLKTPEGALKLPWHHSKTGQPATPAEVRSTFERVRQAAVQYKQDHPNAKGIPSATARNYRIWFCRKVLPPDWQRAA